MTTAPPTHAPITAIAIMVFLPRGLTPPLAPEEVLVDEADAEDCCAVGEAKTVFSTIDVPEVDAIVLMAD